MTAEETGESGLIDFYPYRSRFKVYHRLEPEGRDRQSILEELATMASEEDRIADRGRVSGSISRGPRALPLPDLGGLVIVLITQAFLGSPYLALGSIGVAALVGVPIALRLPARTRVAGPDRH
jgi:hypothetical protein